MAESKTSSHVLARVQPVASGLTAQRFLLAALKEHVVEQPAPHACASLALQLAQSMRFSWHCAPFLANLNSGWYFQDRRNFRLQLVPLPLTQDINVPAHQSLANGRRTGRCASR